MKHPLKGNNKITAQFGPWVHPISGKHTNHNGVDLISLDNQTIYAPEGGEITAARKSNAAGGGYGYYIKMVGDSGHEHILAHMKSKSFEVSTGDLVDQGDELGTIGATGNVTGAHLHWEVRVRGKFTNPLDHITDDVAPEPEPMPAVFTATKKLPTIHTVVRGDTVWALSREFGVSVRQIAEWSGLKNASVIRVGQKLTVKK
jgi:murein DD-endopeptidase MepM/ murein hydrolase activator NlpD